VIVDVIYRTSQIQWCLLQLVVYMYCTSSEPNLSYHDSEKYYFDPTVATKVPFPSLSEEASVDLTIIVPAYNEEKRCMLLTCCWLILFC